MEVAANQTLLPASGTSMGARPAGSGVWPRSLFLLSPSDQKLTAKTCLGQESANVIKSRVYPGGSGLGVVFKEV